jgi:glycogen debranching enzyme
VINVAEEFDLTGDRTWLEGQKDACEKALNFLMRREVGGTGLVAMMTDSVKQRRGSDWIDVVWAAYENAFVNAALYEALELWADDEDALGDPGRAVSYRDFAERLKTSFNRPIADGGFWDPANQWYIYWRDKDGSIHGNNLVPPVNFAAIAYGICDGTSKSHPRPHGR